MNSLWQNNGKQAVKQASSS